MINKKIIENIKNLLELSDYNISKNSFAERENAGKKYLNEAKDEIDEVFEEYRENNKIYLEDELGDVFWDYLQSLKILERDGYIDSVDGVFKHSFEKYSERLSILEDREYLEEKKKIGNDKTSIKWIEIKNKQKKELKERHVELYG